MSIATSNQQRSPLELAKLAGELVGELDPYDEHYAELNAKIWEFVDMHLPQTVEVVPIVEQNPSL